MRYKKGLNSEQKEILRDLIVNQKRGGDYFEQTALVLTTAKYKPWSYESLSKSDFNRVIVPAFKKLGLSHKILKKGNHSHSVFYTAFNLDSQLRQKGKLFREHSDSVDWPVLHEKFKNRPEWLPYITNVLENKDIDYSDKQIPEAVQKKAKEYMTYIKKEFPELHQKMLRYLIPHKIRKGSLMHTLMKNQV